MEKQFVSLAKHGAKVHNFRQKQAQRNKKKWLAFLIAFDMAGVLLRFTVVVDAYEQEIVGELNHLNGILTVLDLVNGGIGVLIVLEFNDECW